jgi:hypothetical protein
VSAPTFGDDTIVTADVLAEWLSEKNYKVSRFAALRKLKAVAKMRPDIVKRRGRAFYALASELYPYMPELKDTPLHRAIRLLRSRVDELERRADQAARRERDYVRRSEKATGLR